MAEERGYSRVSPGVYVSKKGEVKIKLREASDAKRSGINLAPDADEITSNMSLAFTPKAWERINEAVEARRSAG